MNVTFAHAAIHTPEQARAIIAEALAIADEHADAIVPAEHVFAEACELLGARVSAPLMEQSPAIDLPLMAIPRGRR